MQGVAYKLCRKVLQNYGMSRATNHLASIITAIAFTLRLCYKPSSMLQRLIKDPWVHITYKKPANIKLHLFYATQKDNTGENGIWQFQKTEYGILENEKFGILSRNKLVSTPIMDVSANFKIYLFLLGYGCLCLFGRVAFIMYM